MQLIWAHLLSAVSLGLGTLLVGFIPRCLTNQNRQNRNNGSSLLLSSLLCFGGGVLLATSLVHILPETREMLAASRYERYTEVFLCAGFFLLYLVDEIMHCFYEQHDHPLSPDNDNMRSWGARESDPLLQVRHQQHHHRYEEKQLPYNPDHLTLSSSLNIKQTSTCEHNDVEPPSQLCHVGHEEPCGYGPVVDLGLLVALSTHAFLEGLVVGLEDAPQRVLLLLGAIASHKLVVGFCLGMEVASNPKNSRFRYFMCILIFALGSVGGILVGMCLSKLPKEMTELPIPILQGLAGGTLLYVSVSEIIPRERARWHQNHRRKLASVFQFVAIGIGFFLMALTSFYLES